jgi:hypothetical protein
VKRIQQLDRSPHPAQVITGYHWGKPGNNEKGTPEKNMEELTEEPGARQQRSFMCDCDCFTRMKRPDEVTDFGLDIVLPG